MLRAPRNVRSRDIRHPTAVTKVECLVKDRDGISLANEAGGEEATRGVNPFRGISKYLIPDSTRHGKYLFDLHR